MELSTESQSIDQCMLKHELIKQIYLMIVDMKCRSKTYQSIEQKILMGETTVRNSDIMKACFTEEQSVYTKHLDGLIEKFRTNEEQLQDLKNEINMELSTESQSIDQCMLKHELIKQIYLMIVDMKCRSKLYQSIERKILMGELINEMTIQENIHGTTVRNSDIMKKCFTEEQSVYTISHDILQTIHKQIDNQLKSR
ncbi:unnamed protein product [Schistosoma curassoni]|nr:unnamed protein product [Schistosoma curassoni]